MPIAEVFDSLYRSPLFHSFFRICLFFHVFGSLVYLFFTFLVYFIDSQFSCVYTKRGLIVRLGGAPWSCYMVVLINHINSQHARESVSRAERMPEHRPWSGISMPFAMVCWYIEKGCEALLFLFLYDE